MKKIKLIEVNNLFNPYVSFFGEGSKNKFKFARILRKLFK